MSSNNFICVAEEEGEEPIELPTEESDNSLLISTLAAQFPGACGLKYRNPESRAWRGVRLSDGRLFPPSDTGWGTHVYVSVMPKGNLGKVVRLFFLFYLLMPCPFTGHKMFCAAPKISLHLVPLQKLLCHHKNQIYWIQIIFSCGTKCIWFFGHAQNILWPVKGQGISK